MLRIIRQFFGPRQTAQQPGPQLETTLVYVRVKPDRQSAHETRIETPPAVSVVPAATASVQPPTRQPKPARKPPRTSGARTPLANLKVFSARQITLLRQIGCRTDRDLLRLTPKRLEKRLADFASSQEHGLDAPLAPPIDRIRSIVRRGRWAIRFAGRFDDMTPRESLLLRAVHRGSRQTLTQDSAGMIRRDLQRLTLSSRGQRILTLDEIPDIDRVKNWIAQARDSQNAAAQELAAATRFRVSSPQEDSQTDVPVVPR